jgi:hypothetical protein
MVGVRGGSSRLKLAAAIGAQCFEAGETMSIPGLYGVVSPANAVIG